MKYFRVWNHIFLIRLVFIFRAMRRIAGLTLKTQELLACVSSQHWLASKLLLYIHVYNRTCLFLCSLCIWACTRSQHWPTCNCLYLLFVLCISWPADVAR
jgi:hypothetical protein